MDLQNIWLGRYKRTRENAGRFTSQTITKTSRPLFSYCDVDTLNPGDCSSTASGDSGGPVGCKPRHGDNNEYNVVHGVVSCGSKKFELKGHKSAPCKAVRTSNYVE